MAGTEDTIIVGDMVWQAGGEWGRDASEIVSISPGTVHTGMVTLRNGQRYAFVEAVDPLARDRAMAQLAEELRSRGQEVGGPTAGPVDQDFEDLLAEEPRFWMISRVVPAGFIVHADEYRSLGVFSIDPGPPGPDRTSATLLAGRLDRPWYWFELLGPDGQAVAAGFSAVDGDEGPVEQYAERGVVGIRYPPKMCVRCQEHPVVSHSAGPGKRRLETLCLACIQFDRLPRWERRIRSWFRR